MIRIRMYGPALQSNGIDLPFSGDSNRLQASHYDVSSMLCT